MQNQDPAAIEALFTERVLLLAASNVGCSSLCSCRAYVAMTMTDEEAAKLKEHATKVTFDKIPSDENIVLQVLGNAAHHKEVLDKIREDRGGKTMQQIATTPELARKSIGTIASLVAGSVIERHLEQIFGIGDGSVQIFRI